jgi:hypothetical protein
VPRGDTEGLEYPIAARRSPIRPVAADSARAAKVSRSWLYTQADIIQALDDLQGQATPTARTGECSANGLGAALGDNQQLGEANKELNRQSEIAHDEIRRLASRSESPGERAIRSSQAFFLLVAAWRRSRRTASRSSSLSPPQTPDAATSKAASRHWGTTGQLRHTVFASAICSNTGPLAPTGKNSSESSLRHAARSRHDSAPRHPISAAITTHRQRQDEKSREQLTSSTCLGRGHAAQTHPRQRRST